MYYFLSDLQLLQRISQASAHLKISQTMPPSQSLSGITIPFSCPKHGFKKDLKAQIHEYFQLNANPSVNVFTIWCAHKSVSRSLLIQQASREQKQRMHTNTFVEQESYS